MLKGAGQKGAGRKGVCPTDHVFSASAALCGAWSVWASGLPAGRTSSGQTHGLAASRRVPHAGLSFVFWMCVK